jgi:hypothetical protein
VVFQVWGPFLQRSSQQRKPGNPSSHCPAGGEHNKGTGNYTLVLNAENPPAKFHWRWCQKCQGLFYGDKPGSVCPVGGEHSAGSGNYASPFESLTLVMDGFPSDAIPGTDV